jgi:3-hydroxyacyl-[acyl-carrier-protein] dehydratase
MAQTAGAICIANAGTDGPPRVVYLMTIDGAKFRKPVVPGDVLEYHVRKTRSRGVVWKFQCEGIVAGAKVAEAEISAMLIDQ